MNILVFPYRDMYFQKKYGPVVRDLQIISALVDSNLVSSIVIVNRPVSLYERVLGKFPWISSGNHKISVIDITSYDLIGPLAGRSWAHMLYDDFIERIVGGSKAMGGNNNILLDFTPLSYINYQCFKGFYVWYDVIDNFTRHNRYTEQEKNIVRDKYSYVSHYADLVTGTTVAAINEFDTRNKIVVSNGINAADKKLYNANCNDKPQKYDIGYTGFITNKLDTELIELLAEKGKYKIAIYGKVYDREVAMRLKGITNVTLMGSFRGDGVPEIMTQFKIGIIPYRKEKEHDGSPIKLYQYQSYGKPVVSSHAYQGELTQNMEYVLIADGLSETEIINGVAMMINQVDASRSILSKRLSLIHI